MTSYLRPGRFAQKVFNPLIMRAGAATTMSVKTRTSGAEQAVPLNVLEFDGCEYLVAPRGETQWVRNLRAAGECELRRKGAIRRLAATEVPVAERGPIIGAYRKRWASSTKLFFTKLPDDADHPVFVLREV